VKKTILIAPFNGALSLSVASQLRNKGAQVAALSLNGAHSLLENETKSQETSDFMEFFITPGSSVSVRTMGIELSARTGGIDEALFIWSKDDAVQDDFLGSGFTGIEKMVDTRIKTNLFIAHETMRLLQKREKPALLFVVKEDPEDNLSLFDRLERDAFRSFADSLLLRSTEAFPVYGLHCLVQSDDTIPELCSRILEERSKKSHGKWLKYTGKSGIFNRF